VPSVKSGEERAGTEAADVTASASARSYSLQADRPRPAPRLRRLLGLALLSLLVLPMPILVVYRFLPPPITPLMIVRTLQGEAMRKAWVPLRSVSPSLVRAVIASEDAKFCRHRGFDWVAIAEASRDLFDGRRLRGASTITMQTAKNLLLLPNRTFLRKGAEAYLTVLLESLWNKHRILEVYLNIVEWGHGVYGAEMAARVHFAKPAAALSPREAALLAAVLPNPTGWSAERPTDYVATRASTISARAPGVEIPAASACQ